MYFEDFTIGTAVLLDETVIEKDAMIDFAGKYDNIRIHTDEEYAKTTNFGALIASGLFSFISMWPRYVEKDLIGDEVLGGKSSKIEWLAPVYAGDVLHGEATISDLIERNEKNGIIQLTLHIYNQNNVLVIRNVSEAVVKKRLK